jgi:tripartite-type tricarboxylate transporter receptor subunit TctC
MEAEDTALAQWSFVRAPRTLFAAILVAAGTIGCGMATLQSASAQQNYPDRPIRLVVPYAAGGSADITARIIAERLSNVIEQPIVIENRPGIVVGTDHVAKATPDGYTLLAAPLAHSVNTSLYKQLPYDTFEDFEPIATFGYFNFVLVVNPKLPVKDLASFIALLKASPNKYNYGSGGVGTTSHIGVELFKSLTDTQAVHVPYRADVQAVVDLIAGRSTFMLCSTPTCMPYIRSGALRALVITSVRRFAQLPDVPTTAEAGLPAYKVLAYYALVAPKNTPSQIVQKMNTFVNETLADETIHARLADLGFEVDGKSAPADTAKLIRSEAERWGPIIKSAGATAD